MISVFSVFSALVIYSLMLIAICLLCKWTGFLEKGGCSVLWVASIAAILRMALPFEIPVANEIRSWKLLGVPYRFLRTHIAILYVLLAIWIIGAVICVAKDIWRLHLAYKNCHSYTIVKDEHVEEIAERCGLKCPILLSPDVDVPYVVGILHHTIYLPYPEVSERDMELALIHEKQHIKTHNAFIRLIFGLISEAVWWNFLPRPFQNAVDKILEMRCDKNVTKNMTEAEKTEYLDMLTRMAERALLKRETLALAMNEFGVVGKSDAVIQQRFRVIEATRKGKLSRYMPPIAQCLVLVLFFVSYLVIFQGAGEPEINRFEEATGVSYHEIYDGPEIGDEMDGTFILKGLDGRYQLCVNYRFNRYLSEEEIFSETYKNLCIFEVNRQ